MVKNISALKKRFRNLPRHVNEALTAQLEREAVKVVRAMEILKPNEKIEINWTWGDAPAGSITLGKVAQNEYAAIRITIYASASSTKQSDFPALTRWFEFGTDERFTKTGAYRGKMTASPFFFPGYRTRKDFIKRNLRNALRRAVKKASK